jgi:hypothetical protein
MFFKEHIMRASSGDGGGGAGGPYDDAPLLRFPRVLTILYNLTDINQSCQGELKDISHLRNLNKKTGLGVSFFLLVCKQTLLYVCSKDFTTIVLIKKFFRIYHKMFS